MKHRLLLLLLPALFSIGRAAGQIDVGDTLTMHIGPADTLTSTVAGFEKAKHQSEKWGERRQQFHGTTHDLAYLDLQMLTFYPDKSYTAGARERPDRLLIVREGSLMVTVGDKKECVGPGGIGIFAAGDEVTFENTGTKNTTCWLLSFWSKDSIDLARTKPGLPLFLNWTDLTVKTTDKGESRPMFSLPTGWLKKLDMHATTLNPGQISHPQHVHRNEEIILMRSGHVRMHISNGYRKAGPGDIIFLASGVPHNLENSDEGRCEYFALQWER